MGEIKVFLLVIGVAIALLFWFYTFAGQTEVNKEILKQQENQIEILHDTVKVKNFQQKIINKTSVNADVTLRRKFLLSAFKERANSDQ